jgi:Spy/CpxP family protein refolding chaperone
MNRTAIIAAFFAATLLSVPAFAQPAGAPARAAGPALAGQPVLGGQGQRAGANLARLGLDAATAQKVQQIHQKYRTERQGIRQQTQTHRQRIQQLLAANSDDQNAYRAALTGLQNARKLMQASKDREVAELQQVLTPKQQAQLLAAMKGRANKGNNRGGQPPRGRRGRGRGAGVGPNGAGR